MTKTITLGFVFILLSLTSCKSTKYIPPQDEKGKLCIQQIDNIKRNCERNAQEDFRRCKKNKGKNCRLNNQTCSTNYKNEYIRCGGKIVTQ